MTFAVTRLWDCVQLLLGISHAVFIEKFIAVLSPKLCFAQMLLRILLMKVTLLTLSVKLSLRGAFVLQNHMFHF